MPRFVTNHLFKGLGPPMSEKDKKREKLESLLDKWSAEFDKSEINIRLAICGEDWKRIKLMKEE
jgi:hypothetical protein